MAGLLSNLRIRNEMVGFHLSDKFGENLEAQIEPIIDQAKRGAEDFALGSLPEINGIEKVVFDRLKMRIKIIGDTPNFAAIIPFHLNENATLMKDYFRDFGYAKSQEIFKDDLGKTFHGTVDVDNVVLGGDFTKYVATTYFNIGSMVRANLNKKEMVAILLHELGHNWYACEYTSRMDRANAILMDSIKTVSGDRQKITMVRTKLEKENIRISEETLDGLASPNPVILTKAAFTLASEICYSQMMSGKYDETSFEQLADNFAIRFGYGPYLVTAFEKLYPGGVRMHYFFSFIMSMKQSFQVVRALIAAIMNIFTALNILAGGLSFMAIRYLLQSLAAIFSIIIFSIVTVNQSGEAGRPATYDDLVHRYNRVRLQLVEAIKNRELPKAQAKFLIEQFESISSLIKDVKPYRGLLDMLFNTFNPKDRRAKASIERQQAIESLFSNPLFVSAAKLDAKAS